MTISTTTTSHTTPVVVEYRGLELQIGESDRLLPALPIWVRRENERWQPAGHALDQPSQIGGLTDAPWSRLSDLFLTDEGDSIRLIGIAEPGARPFTLSASDPLGRWSDLQWLPAADRPSLPRRRLDRPPQEPTEPGFVAWYDFARYPLGDAWVGSGWPSEIWYRDETDGVLRTVANGERRAFRFIGIDVRHHEFAISTRMRVPLQGFATGGLELHVDGVPLRIGVGRRPDGTIRIEGSAGAAGTLPAQVAQVDLAVVCGVSTFRFEVVVRGRRVLRRTKYRSESAVTAAGMFAEGTGAPISFSWFEYRGGRVAVANRDRAGR